MQTTLNELTKACYRAVESAFPDAQIPIELIEVTPSTQAKFGHYQCNSAMKLSAILKKNPREIATAIVKHLAFPATYEIAGPGFINITLTTDYLEKHLQTMLQSNRLGIALPTHKERIIVDFSSPNIAKEMHVGHLRSTIIGDAIARLFEFLGDDVLRLNHIGDWGTAFGMLIAYMKEVAPLVLKGEKQTTLTQLMQWYRESKKRFDEDAAFKKQAQLEVVALQSGDALALAAWKIICEISKCAYQEIYDLLDIHLTERGESFYNPLIKDLISDIEKKGLITLSDGAKCIFIEGFTKRDGELLPFILQKSDGGFNYSTTDLAALRHRIQIEKAERIIYLTDSGQSLHFQMLFKVAELAHYLDPKTITVIHVGFGLVLGPDGKKFKTRSGDTERLIDLLLEAIKRADIILKERNPEMDKDVLEKTATILGINAIKYADLASQRTQDYVFSYDRMLRFEGNTAAFLMYAYVRINSIKRKVGIDVNTLPENTLQLTHPAEITLALQLNQFADVLKQFAHDLFPHRLAEYLYHLAEEFNVFFRDCRVEGDAAQNSRLLLCELTARVLHQGLSILGLKVVERM